MKPVLKALLVLALFALPWVGYADWSPLTPAPKPNVDAQIRAALALAQVSQQWPAPAPIPAQPKANCPCGCGCTDCDCTFPGECGNPNCTCGAKKSLSLNAAIDRAVAENKPLCIWVRQVCVPCQKSMPGYLHVHVTEYERVNGQKVEDCCVIVARPVSGEMIIAGTIQGCPDDLAEQARAALALRRPTFYMPPPPPPFAPVFFGGFVGGGCRS